uniref:GPI mannosyltransferase 2 n=1 Tax=Aceria tosichella TaxID=561515 RepID=A0A6G1S9J4_9ACAR
MTLISPSNLSYILGVSISSRLLVITIQLISNLLIEDHNADAYRNKYYKALTDNSGLFDMLPVSYRFLYVSIEGFTKWDAQYFLEISLDGYVSEQHLAFLPFYPLVISFIRQNLFGHTRPSFEHFLPTYSIQQIPTQDVVSVSSLENYIQAALVGVAINNFVLVPLICILLFALTRLVKRSDEVYANTVVWWFCFNPASIFFSSCYSESLFAALTLSALLIIEYRSQKYLSNHPPTIRSKRYVFEPLNHLNRLIYIVLPALIPLALASATRSNGLVTIGFIIFQFLVKYVTVLMTDRRIWSWLAYLSVALELIQDILVLVMSSVLAASGYISFQIYSFILFCTSSQNHHPKESPGPPRPFWCDNIVPHPYGHVQAKYWNVGLFKYYEIKQLPNFLLAMPISYIVLVGSLRSSRQFTKTFISSFKEQLAYYMHTIFITLLCSVSINIQVITRLVASSCPAVYWICADTMRNRKSYRILMAYFLSYFLIGTVLHSNFYPWT